MESYTISIVKIRRAIELAKENGLTAEETLSLLAKYNLIKDSDSDDDMD